jgi:4-amino-4-deoxy-L-arabinose transferase-like glycosyltransferase
VTAISTRPPSDPSGVDARSALPRLIERVWRPAGQPAWAWPALAGLLIATAVLYLWGLGASGWANPFYSAAVQAGSENGKAFFFGASDAGNAISVDKTPASLWLTGLSVRMFGLNSWSILVPQALAGVATVGVLYATVRRWFGPVAGLLAGVVVALTPVAALMFRYNNPEALLVLLLTLAAYACIRALETASTRWLVLVGVFVGFGFLTKMAQALLVVPAFALAYLIAAPTHTRRRIVQLSLAGLAMVVAAGWWVAIVELVPASSRPYIGGSQTNSVLELVLGYNGLDRLASGNGGPERRGQTGLFRMFDEVNGGPVSWLLPAALILLVAGLVLTARAARVDRTRAALVLWGGWLLATAVTFSLMGGVFHGYYGVALVPAIGALVGLGTVVLWRRRDRLGTLLLAGTLAVTVMWSWVVLGRTADWQPWLRPTVLVVGLGAAAVLAATQLPAGLRPASLLRAGLLPAGLLRAGLLRRGRHADRRWVAWGAGVAGTVGVIMALAGPAAYAIETAATPHSGAIPVAGPVPGGEDRGGGPPGKLGGLGALLYAGAPDAKLVAYLTKDADRYTWVAAAIGSNNAAGFQLATRRPVIPIGGFNGTDPSPTLEQFQRYVDERRVHFFVGNADRRAKSATGEPQRIAAWVAETFAPKTVSGVPVYDLTRPR